MTVLPRLKPILVQHDDDSVIIHRRALERTHLSDEDGSVAALLKLLSQGEHDPDGLVRAMADDGFPITADDVATALAQFDDWRILEQAGGDSTLPAATRDRYQSALRFYDIFASLGHTSADQHRAMANAHVLLLGAGGVGSGVLQSLVGMGAGRVTLVDFDVVETKNLARQFAYGLGSVGRRKVDAASEWAEAYSAGTVVHPVHRRVDNADAIRELAAGTDLVICGIDTPDDIHLMVNEACCDLGIPYVAGGLAHSTLCYWSVHPGQSPCWQCLELHRARLPEAGAARLSESATVNRAIGPVVQILCGLMAMEAMRFITRSDPPVALAAYHILEIADGMTWARHSWDWYHGCPACPHPS